MKIKYTLTYTYKNSPPDVLHGTLPGKVHIRSFGRILDEVDARLTPRRENWSTMTITIDQSHRWEAPE